MPQAKYLFPSVPRPDAKRIAPGVHVHALQTQLHQVALQLEAEMLNATIPQIFPLLLRALLGVNVDRGYVYANHAQ